MAVATSASLSVVMYVNQKLAEALKTWNRRTKMHTKVTNAVLNIPPSRLPKITMSIRNNIA